MSKAEFTGIKQKQNKRRQVNFLTFKHKMKKITESLYFIYCKLVNDVKNKPGPNTNKLLPTFKLYHINPPKPGMAVKTMSMEDWKKWKKILAHLKKS